MDKALRDRLVERLYPTATFVFLVVTSVVWGALWLEVVSPEVEQALLMAWSTYLGGFGGYMFGHNPQDEQPQGQGMSEAATHRLISVVEKLAGGAK